MTPIQTIEIVGKSYIRCETWHQFRFEKGNRRIGMKYWVRMELDGVVHWQGHTIDEKTDTRWLINAVNLGCIYMTEFDFNITLSTGKKLEEISNS